MQDRTRLFNLITENMTDYVTIFGLDLNEVRYVTPSFTRVSGYTLDEINQVPLRRKMTKESYQRVMKIVAEKLSPENLADPQCDLVVETDIEFISKSGKPDWYHCTYRLIRDAEGRPDCFLETGHKITERKRVEAALRASEEKYRALFSQSVSGIYLHDFEGRILDANPMACLQTGHSRDELLQLTVFDLLPATVGASERKETMLRQWSQWQPEQRYTLQGEHRRKDGTVFPVDISTGVVRFNDRLSILGIVSDSTERSRAEEALRHSQERYKSIVSSMSDLIFIIDEEDRYIDVHGEASEALLLAPEEFLGKAVAAVTPSHVHERYRECAARVRQSGETRRFEYSVPVHGEPRWFLASLDLHADGRKIVAGIRDITDRKRAEAGLKKAHDELEQRVQQRTAELSEANARLRRERRTLEHMLRASDHERRLIAYDIHDGLAQELAGAIMQFQLYQQHNDTRPEDAQKAFEGGMALLRQGHNEARRLISGVRPPILDESGVLAAIAHLVHDPAFEDGPKVDFRSRVTFHRLDPVAENVIYRIVQEALSNARNHSRSTGILVRILQRGDRLRIDVRDWGVGFDPGKVAENRFGLEGIRERARLLGGKCRIRSTPGGGTTVVVELPVVLPQGDRP